MNINKQTTKIVGLGNLDTRLQEIRDNLQSLLMSNEDLVIQVFSLFYLEVLYGILSENHYSLFNQVTNILPSELFWEKRKVLKDGLLGDFEKACSNLTNIDSDCEKWKRLIRQEENEIFNSVGHKWVLGLRGPKGEKGDSGDNGEKGDKGGQGEAGLPGKVPDLDGILVRIKNVEIDLEKLEKLQPKLNPIFYFFLISLFMLLSIILIVISCNSPFG